MRSWLFVVFSSLALSACFVEDAQKVADSGSDGGSGGGGGGGAPPTGGGGGDVAMGGNTGVSCSTGSVTPSATTCTNPLNSLNWYDTCDLAKGERCAEVSANVWGCVDQSKAVEKLLRFACLPFDTCAGNSLCDRGLCTRFLACTSGTCAFDADCTAPSVSSSAGCTTVAPKACNYTDTPACTTTDGCNRGYTCDMSTVGSWRCSSVLGGTTGTSCTQNSDCVAGLVCEGLQRTCKVPAGAPARSTTDCVNGTTLVNGYCTPPVNGLPVSQGRYRQWSDGGICAESHSPCPSGNECCATLSCLGNQCQ
jgi:hypothetical protein